MNRELAIILKLRDEATKELTAFGNKINDLQPAFKKMAVVGSVAFTAIGGALAYAVKESGEAGKIQAQLNAVLKSTGEIAGITAQKAIDLADALAQVTVYDNDMILSAENMLLTFTNISENVFPEATRVMLDMSEALGQDLKSSAIQLGKALNDPIIGVSALRRVGVNFTESQQNLIQSLVDSGKTMEAQRLILKELNTEFGGSASINDFGDRMAKLRQKLNDFAELIGSYVTPTLEKLFEKLGVVITKVIKWAEENPMLVKTIIAISLAVTALTAVIGLAGIAMGIFATATGVALLPIIAITASITALIAGLALLTSWLSDKVTKSIREQIKVDEEYADKINGLTNKLVNLRQPIEGVAEKMKELAEKTTEASQKVSDLNAEIAETVKAHINAQKSLRQQLADEIIAQEQKVADFQKQVADKTEEIKKQALENSSSDRVKQLQEDLLTLQNSLMQENTALETAKNNNLGLTEELAEAKRRASLTEFERRMEDINKEMEAENLMYQRKIAILNAELAEAKKYQSEMIALEEAYTKSVEEQEAQRLKAYKDTTEQIKATLAERAQAQNNASGGGLFSGGIFGGGIFGGPGSLGSNPVINDGIVQNGKVITTHPDDYLIATKNPSSLGGGSGVVVNVYGDVSGADLVEKVQNALMKSLRMDTKFSV